MQVTRKMRIANEGQRTGIQHSRRSACYLLMAPGAFHPDGLSGPSPAANQTSAEASVIDLPHAKGRASASLWRCAMPQMVARIFQPDAKLCYAMRLTIMSAAWIYGSRIAGDADQVAGMIAPVSPGCLGVCLPRPTIGHSFHSDFTHRLLHPAYRYAGSRGGACTLLNQISL
jgi:hypothetical protein